MIKNKLMFTLPAIAISTAMPIAFVSCSQGSTTYQEEYKGTKLIDKYESKIKPAEKCDKNIEQLENFYFETISKNKNILVDDLISYKMTQFETTIEHSNNINQKYKTTVKVNNIDNKKKTISVDLKTWLWIEEFNDKNEKVSYSYIQTSYIFANVPFELSMNSTPIVGESPVEFRTNETVMSTNKDWSVEESFNTYVETLTDGDKYAIEMSSTQHYPKNDSSELPAAQLVYVSNPHYLSNINVIK